jgi:hypothetical protein
MKYIDAVRRGTTYGDNDNPKARTSKTPTCAYHKFGCENDREPHKTLRSTHCRYHYLYKSYVNDGKNESITQKEWMENVKRIWASENKESITNSQITTMDVVNEEFEGDSTCLDSQYLSSNSSDYSEPDFDPSMSYSMVCEKKKLLSEYGSQHSDSSFHDNDMLSSSDEDDDNYKSPNSNCQTTDGNDSVVANEKMICHNDMRCIHDMTQVHNTNEELSSVNEVEDENHVIV